MKNPEGLMEPPKDEEQVEQAEQKEKIKSREELLEEARSIFHGDKYESFSRLGEALESLLDASGEESRPGIYEEVVGRDYLLEAEKRLADEGNRDGIYLPFDELGGGDYVELHPRGGRVGEVELFDVVGHGLDAFWPKALIMRMIELRRSSGAKPEDLFPHLDEYIASLPTDAVSGVSGLSLAEANFTTQEDGRSKLVIELAGNIRVFTRDSGGQIEVLKMSGYPPLGYGMVEVDEKGESRRERLLHTFDLDPSTEVFLCSDGLFDIMVDVTLREDGPIFGEVIHEEFAEEKRGLSPEEFKDALVDYVRLAKTENRVTDDVTVLHLTPAPAEAA
ncbi:MAG: SpoIIE family protein phosphatase [Patescibacteria group bacterium]|nr:SpoIIE family protein phosphatase [Patescibacteria group bacterium]